MVFHERLFINKSLIQIYILEGIFMIPILIILGDRPPRDFRDILYDLISCSHILYQCEI